LLQFFKQFVRAMVLSIPALRMLAYFMMMLMVLFGALIYAAEKGEWTVDAEHPAGAFLRPKPGGQGDLEARAVTPFFSLE